jgi:hypothetical protein
LELAVQEQVVALAQQQMLAVERVSRALMEITAAQHHLVHCSAWPEVWLQ